MAGGQLSAAKIRNIKTAGTYFDGAGLRLQVTKAGGKTWIFRFQINGKTREMGLGSFNDLTLKQARETASDMRALARQGIDPIAHRKAQQHQTADANVWTFDKCAKAYIDAHAPGWSNAKHVEQWRSTMQQYCSPVFGNLPVSAVDTGLVMQAIEPIWQTRTETASRVRGRIENILSWAIVRGYREGPNPAIWRGHLSMLLPARAKVQKVRHHPAMDYQDVSAFMKEIKPKISISAKALQFTILTACRTKEVIGARREEIDGNIWTVPLERMKATREHRVPLSTQALELLDSLPVTEGWLFPSIHYHKPISNMAMLKFLKTDMQRPSLTVHGFRSSFRDWCAEQTNYPRELAEASLAHVLQDKTEAAYQRGDMLEKRRRLMQAWADYCDKVQAKSLADIVKIRRNSNG